VLFNAAICCERLNLVKSACEYYEKVLSSSWLILECMKLNPHFVSAALNYCSLLMKIGLVNNCKKLLQVQQRMSPFDRRLQD